VKIVVREFGGLGNQLFQYAAGRFYARRYNATLSIAGDPAWNAHCNGYPRPCLLQHFSIKAQLEERSLVDRIAITDKSWLRVAAAPLMKALRVQLISEQPHQQYLFSPALPLSPGVQVLYLQGYFQTRAIVEAVAGELRQELRFNTRPPESSLRSLRQIAAATHPVSLHIRRGDAILPWEGKVVLSPGYYEQAIALFKERFSSPVFFVFSDDMQAARAILPRDADLVFIEHNDEFSAHEDLRLMAACRHHILANSTFSWWGAWLNASPEKMVVAPQRWFLTEEERHLNLLDPGWILLDPKPEEAWQACSMNPKG
jgi:hypothetical protein